MIIKLEKVDFLRDQFAEACNRELELRDFTREKVKDWLHSLRPSPITVLTLALGIYLNLSAFCPSSAGMVEEPEWLDYFLAGYGTCMLVAVLPRVLQSIAGMFREFLVLIRALGLYRHAKKTTKSARLAFSKQSKMGRDK